MSSDGRKSSDALPPRLPLAGLLAVRHGESVSNVVFREAARAARPDESLAHRDARVPLTAGGREQAAALGRRLAALPEEERPDLVVCSPYARARETWEVAAEAWPGAPGALVDERLRDREMGAFELMTPLAIEARAPEEARRRATVGEWWYRPPGGESFPDVTLRVRDFLTELAAAAPGRRALLVAHDAVVVALGLVISGLGTPPPAEASRVPNASLTGWAGDGTRLRPAFFGDTAHLAGLDDPGTP
ncbi:histidine phosphatase family protein [Streptomyces sp. 3MP-14]|uniref:Histidine phosphatase family protein n=1 Tax=Streptomyces mimosae TaxID=2586635 RepID=A0A5N6APQ5_9ACTN|nr:MULTISPECIES: histidine phosphatase family protein [Streptomyces]KAB8170827.1 histidine phosphatase family protein [Streptomyces mimosae]KAB8179912.1 histidine phosphatase family protein [Streptomyces sp. 3MP-14]